MHALHGLQISSHNVSSSIAHSHSITFILELHLTDVKSLPSLHTRLSGSIVDKKMSSLRLLIRSNKFERNARREAKLIVRQLGDGSFDDNIDRMFPNPKIFHNHTGFVITQLCLSWWADKTQAHTCKTELEKFSF